VTCDEMCDCHDVDEKENIVNRSSQQQSGTLRQFYSSGTEFEAIAGRFSFVFELTETRVSVANTS